MCKTSPCFRLETSRWSSCYLGGADCGEGVRVRNRTCRRSDGQLAEPSNCGVKVESSENLSESLLLLHEKQTCHIPCPGRCLLSSWSRWSPCVAVCDEPERRARLHRGWQVKLRHILQLPGPAEPACPLHTWQSRSCKTLSCVRFKWKTGPWTGNRREVWCQRTDGLPVSSGLCKAELRPLSTLCSPACSGGKTCTVDGCRCPPGFVSISSSGPVQCDLQPCSGQPGNCTSPRSKRSAKTRPSSLE